MPNSLIMILLSLSLILTVSESGVAAQLGTARIRLTEGDVYLMTPETKEWEVATLNNPFDEGDVIWCSDGGRVEIQLPDGSIARLDHGSSMEMLAIEDGFTHMHLSSGTVYLRTMPSTKENSLQLDADDTTVIPSARTRFRIDMMPNSEEDVSIFKGSAYVESGKTATRVRAGEMIVLEEERNELLPLKTADNWDRWNAERDRAQNRSAKLESYMPDELHPYSDELGANGYWVRVPQYGMVWRPTVIVTGDWAPYRAGRWGWRGGSYVWISQEPWGWAPYHFGRWIVVAEHGWCWLPPERGDVYWAPAYVGWHHGDGKIAWTPLAPGEIYYGKGNYGRNSVNVTTINASTQSYNVFFKNSQIKGATTIVSENDFQKRRFEAQRAREDYRPPPRISQPVIKPIREPTSLNRLPVRNPTFIKHDLRELKTRFPRINPSHTASQRGSDPKMIRTENHLSPNSDNMKGHDIGAERRKEMRVQSSEKKQEQVIKAKRVWKVREKPAKSDDKKENYN